MPDNNTYRTQMAIKGAVCEPVTKDRLKEELYNIFNNPSEHKVNLLFDKIVNVVNNLFEDKENNEFIFIYFRSNHKIISDLLSEYLNGNQFDTSIDTRKKFYNLVHQYIISTFSPLDCKKYVLRTLPIWSKLKSMLLDDRTDVNMKQWEYGVNCYEKDSKATEIKKAFQNIEDYHQITNKMAFNIIYHLVNNAIGKGEQFDKTIGYWFTKKNEETKTRDFDIIPKRHNVHRITLYKIAYGFALAPNSIDDLGHGTVNSTRDPFDFEENMYCFGLNYKMKYTDITDIISKYKNQMYLTQREIQTDEFSNEYDKAVESLNTFFDKYKNIVDSETILDEYLKLLKNVGSYDKEEIRKNVAKKSLEDIVEKINIINIHKYYENNPIDEKLLSVFYPLDIKAHNDLKSSLLKKITKKRDTVKCLYKKNDEDIKFQTLSCIFDGKGYNYKGEKTLRNTIIEGYENINKKQLKIERETILRLGYLSTIVDYINGEISDDELINSFEKITNAMLTPCLFHKLYCTFPEDVQMYLALSCKDYCKLDFYQAITN